MNSLPVSKVKSGLKVEARKLHRNMFLNSLSTQEKGPSTEENDTIQSFVLESMPKLLKLSTRGPLDMKQICANILSSI